MTAVSRETPPAPDAAQVIFAERLELAQRYVSWLADAGTVRGLLGPREVPRLWERHVLNSAALQELLPQAASVADIGSGAGLPGIPLAIARPDLRITLIELLLRRTTFLSEVIADLALDNVTVLRGRAEDVKLSEVGASGFDVVTSRAVAPLDRLARWSLPLTRLGGIFLPMKGSSAPEEINSARGVLADLGAPGDPEVLSAGVGLVDEPITVVRIVKDTRPVKEKGQSGGRRGGPRRARGGRREA